MATTILAIEIRLQEPVGKRAKKGKIVRKDSAGGAYRERAITLPCSIAIGPQSDANMRVRILISRALRERRKPTEDFFYVIGEFEDGRTKAKYFKTIVPRTKIPL